VAQTSSANAIYGHNAGIGWFNWFGYFVTVFAD
jgi:hypothetical protein